jgi:hypothetical protein
MRNGVPFHNALGMTSEEAARVRLDTVERTAMTIIFSEFEGNRFNWSTMTWDTSK